MTSALLKNVTYSFGVGCIFCFTTVLIESYYNVVDKAVI